MRTKAEILLAKVEMLRDELGKATAEIDGLKGTTCNLRCDGCGKIVHTEWEFAQHFQIPDERYLNLGGCPKVDSNSQYMYPRVSITHRIITQIG